MWIPERLKLHSFHLKDGFLNFTLMYFTVKNTDQIITLFSRLVAVFIWATALVCIRGGYKLKEGKVVPVLN
jgi:hypothetical protein